MVLVGTRVRPSPPTYCCPGPRNRGPQGWLLGRAGPPAGLDHQREVDYQAGQAQPHRFPPWATLPYGHGKEGAERKLDPGIPFSWSADKLHLVNAENETAAPYVAQGVYCPAICSCGGGRLSFLQPRTTEGLCLYQCSCEVPQMQASCYKPKWSPKQCEPSCPPASASSTPSNKLSSSNKIGRGWKRQCAYSCGRRGWSVCPAGRLWGRSSSSSWQEEPLSSQRAKQPDFRIFAWSLPSPRQEKSSVRLWPRQLTGFI